MEYDGPPSTGPDADQLREHFIANIDAARAAHPEGKEFTFMDAVKAGWQGSSTGLLVRQALPDTQLPEDAPMAQRLLSKAVGLVGDIPEMGAGMVAGLAASGPLGGAGGAFALPTAMREFLMDRYAKGEYKDAGDLIARAGPVLMDTARSAALGVATAGVGKFAGIAAAEMSPVAKYLATAGSEVVALTGMGAAMAGKIPTAEDFIDNALLIGGTHLVGRVAGKLREAYARGSIEPAKLSEAVANSEPLKQELVSENPGIGPELEALMEKPEPTPIAEEKTPSDSPPKANSASELGKAIGDMGGGTGEGLRDHLWDAVQKGETEEGGQKSGILQAAKLVRDAGGLQTKPEALDFLEKAQGIKDAKKGRAYQQAMQKLVKDAREGLAAPALTDPIKPAEANLKLNPALVEESPIIAKIADVWQGGVPTAEAYPVRRVPGVSEGNRFPVKVPGTGPATDIVTGTAEQFPTRQVPGVDIQSPVKVPYQEPVYPTRSVPGVEGNQFPTKVPGTGPATNIVTGTAEQSPVIQVPGVDVQSPVKLPGGSPATNVVGLGPGGSTATIPYGQTPGAAALGGSPPGALPPAPPGPTAPAFPVGTPPAPAGPSADLATVLSRKATGPVIRPKQTWGQAWDTFYTSVVDDLHPIKVLAQQLSQGKIPDLRAYTLANLTRGSLGLSAHWLEHRPVGFDGKPIAGAEGLRAILSDVAKQKSVTGASPMDEFSGYLMSERSEELTNRMKSGLSAPVETGIDPGAAYRTAEHLAPTYKKYADRIYAYKNHLLDYLQKSGVLSDEVIQKIKDANRAHVPFYRALESREGGPRVGSGATNPVKRISGSELLIEDPLSSIVKDTHTFIKAAENNAVGEALAKLHDLDPDNGLMTKIAARSKRITITAEEVTKFIEHHALDPDPKEGFDIFRHFRDPLADNEIAVYRDGTREVYQVPDETATAVRDLDRSSANLLTKILSAPALLERAGMTGALDFGLRHIVRSNILAPIISENQHFPVVGLIKGLGAMFEKGELYEKWVTSGAFGSTAADLSRDTLGGKVFELSRDTGLMDRAMNVVRHPLDSFVGMSHALVSAMDTGLRLGEFDAALKNGKSIEDAALSSRQIGLDYARSGTYTRGLNRIVAFQNAGIQGLDTVVRAAANNPKAVLAKGLLYIGLPTLANWYANRDDSRYKFAPQWQKDMFWVIPTDKWEAVPENQAALYPDDLRRTVNGQSQVNNGVTFRIPKPFEPGVVFGSLIERVLERFGADNPRAFEGLDETLFHALPGVIPTAFQPILEQWANKSILTGSPIVNHAAEKLLPEYRYNDYTSETAKLLGKFAGVVPYGEKLGLAAPAVIDHYIQGWTGTLGKYAVQAADKALQAAGITNPPPAPESTLADIPFVKAFIVRHPSAGMAPIEEFHQRYEQAAQQVDTLKALAKDGNIDAYMKLLNTGSDVPPKLTGIQSALSNLGQLIHSVNINPDMTPSDKRQLIDGYYYQMCQLARAGNETSRAFEEMMKEKVVQ